VRAEQPGLLTLIATESNFVVRDLRNSRWFDLVKSLCRCRVERKKAESRGQSMMLFICHASEDKDDFVAPLAAELSKKYEVWYDDYELTLGDSLPEKIDDGLQQCDFGVVVLSKAFFAKKKWGRKELDKCDRALAGSVGQRTE
jgi:TIR domain-containing protein